MTSVALPVAARLPRGLRAVAWIGIALGLLGAWIALPPISARSWVWSLVICLIAVMLGIGVIIRGERRFGGYAVASGVLGFALAFSQRCRASASSRRSSSGRRSSPRRSATRLRSSSRRSEACSASAPGVVNIGLEGMMLIGAFFGILGADKLGQWYYGLIVAIVAGGLMALLHAVLSIQLRADQIVGGTAINFLALGLTGYLFIDIYGQEGTPTDISSIPQVNLGFLDDVPFFGTVFGHLNLMIWVALLLIPLAWVVLFKTPLGLRIRVRRRASEGRRHGRHHRLRRPLWRRRALGHARRLRWRVSLDRVRQLVQREHDGGSRVHRTRGRDLRQLAAVRRRRRLSPVRLLERTRAAASRVLGLGCRVVPGTPVRAHLDRCCRRDRSLDPAGGSGSPLSKIVRRNARATWSVVLGAALRPDHARRDRRDAVLGLLRAPARGLRDPGSPPFSASSRWCSPVGPGRSIAPRSAARGVGGRPASAGCSAFSGSAWPPRRRSPWRCTECCTRSSSLARLDP